MTPFGTVVEFDKAVITSDKKTAGSGKKSSKSTDFDSFLMGLDKKIVRKPVKRVPRAELKKPDTKPPEPETIKPSDKPTTSKAIDLNQKPPIQQAATDFDNFLNGLDSKPKPKASKPANDSAKTKQPAANASQPTPTDSNTKSTVVKKSSDPLKVIFVCNENIFYLHTVISVYSIY